MVGPASRFHGVLDRSGQILRFPLGLVDLAIDLKLGVADHLADSFLDRAFDLFDRSGDAIPIHDSVPLNWRRCVLRRVRNKRWY